MSVEEAIGLLKSIHMILSQCSTDTNDYVPQDFDEQLLKIFQTTSVEDFNSVFDFELKQARHKADKFGGKAVFPTKEQTFELATNTYQRLTGPGDDYKWCQPTKQGAAFTYRLQGNPEDGPPCYNCGTHGCTPSICKEPLDPERIKRNSNSTNASRNSKFSLPLLLRLLLLHPTTLRPKKLRPFLPTLLSRQRNCALSWPKLSTDDYYA